MKSPIRGQWAAFIRKKDLGDIAPNSFEDVVTQLQSFFHPMVEHQIGGNGFSATWQPGGPWKKQIIS